MKPKRPTSQRRQPTPSELTGGLLDLIRAKFYQGEGVAFIQDRKRLLDWAVLYPASWFNTRGVTIPTERYREIMTNIILDAAANGAQEIKYLPAWLAKVVQSHFRAHGEDYYNEAKSARNLVEAAMLAAGSAVGRSAAPDAIKLLAETRRVLAAPKRPKEATEKRQLSLL